MGTFRIGVDSTIPVLRVVIKFTHSVTGFIPVRAIYLWIQRNKGEAWIYARCSDQCFRHKRGSSRRPKPGLDSINEICIVPANHFFGKSAFEF